MANHTYVTTRQRLTAEKLQEALTDIAKKRFDDRIVIVFDDFAGWFRVQVPHPEQWSWEFPIWLASQRKVECRHTHNQFLTWIMVLIQNELAVRWDGWISDEGVSERWRGDTAKLPTFWSWHEMRLRSVYGPDEATWKTLESRRKQYIATLDEIEEGWRDAE